MRRRAGTHQYMAPEMLNGQYGMECDLWSIGVLVYVLVSGYLPFQSESIDELFKLIQDGQYDLSHPEFESVSDECKDLIKCLLVVNPYIRMDAKKALEHKWFEDIHNGKKN